MGCACDCGDDNFTCPCEQGCGGCDCDECSAAAVEAASSANGIVTSGVHVFAASVVVLIGGEVAS